MRLSVFHSTHPRGVRPIRRSCGMLAHQFQSTHPHGVRPQRNHPLTPEQSISIHAPAWGATLTSPAPAKPSTDFNPRTRMGCDKTRNRSKAEIQYFNPRTRMGCDYYDKYYTLYTFDISIHAPAWGATTSTQTASAGFEFQSTHPHGVRLLAYHAEPSASAFQSTHPHGVRRFWSTKITRAEDFNPRTRMGCD